MPEKITKLTDEQTAQLAVYRDRWIANAMSTKAMDADDKLAMVEAVRGLYEAAGLTPPPDNRIVFTPSPMTAAFAAGAAAWLWHCADSDAATDATRNATFDATFATTDAATHAATRAATSDAAYATTDAATWAATRDATRDAIWGATADATRAATRAATSAATRAAIRYATLDANRDATRAAAADAIRAAAWGATTDATTAATRDATYTATRDATADATEAATTAATASATHAATRDATAAATRAATEAATTAATASATYDATLDAAEAAAWAATAEATSHATADAIDAVAAGVRTGKEWYDSGACADAVLKIAGPGGLECAKNHWRIRNGGNQWSGWCSFLSFWMREMRIDKSHGADLSKWDPYEKAAIHGGPRYMHEKFCIISDRPKTLLVDDMNRPHCEDGPFCEWRDGTRLWSWHGARVPGWVIERQDEVTVEKIKAEPNAETRRAMREIYGDGRYLADAGSKLIDADYEGARKGAASRCLIEDDEGDRFLVGTDGSTGRTYYMRVPRSVDTCVKAHAIRCGFDETKILNKS